MSKRKVAIGLVGVGAIIGAYLWGLLPKFGTGTALTTSNNTPAITPSTKPETPASKAAPNKPGESQKRPVVALPVLEVIVNGDAYEIVDPEGSGIRRIRLEDVIKLAKATLGNDEGIRVRILRRRSARVVAWNQLYDELQKAGLSEDSIRMPKQLLPDAATQAQQSAPPTLRESRLPTAE